MNEHIIITIYDSLNRFPPVCSLSLRGVDRLRVSPTGWHGNARWGVGTLAVYLKDHLVIPTEQACTEQQCT